MNCLALLLVSVVYTTQVFSVQTAGSPIIPGYRCPPKDIARGCKGPKDCLYPNPKDCNSFIQCNDGGIAYRMPCPEDLEWNNRRKQCVWPHESTCRRPIRPTRPTNKPTKPERPDFECPAKDIIETKCMGPKDCLYPNPDNCHTFIQCTVNPGGVSGTPVVMPCPDGLQWNDTGKICDWPRLSTCPSNKPKTTTTTTTTVRTKRTTTTTTTTPRPPFVCPAKDIIETKCMGPKDCLYPNPDNCITFIQCTVNPGGVSGTPVAMPCPSGLEWNDRKKICDWPSLSTCLRY